MVRSYRKYEPSGSFGTVCTASSNSLWTDDGSSAGRAYVGANENVLCWNVKKGELISRWEDADNKSEVTCLAQHSGRDVLFAVGYADGSIRVWDALLGEVYIRFDGHRSAVTHLQFDRKGIRLVSGSKDTNIIMWNLSSQMAEFKLRGHKDQITGLSFIKALSSVKDLEEEEDENCLISTSKDAFIKLWDLSSPHCMETHIAQNNGECWALGLAPGGTGCITAGLNGELGVWNINLEGLLKPESGERLMKLGTLRRKIISRTTGICFHPKQNFLAVHGPDKTIELFQIRSEDELRKHMQRKKQRKKKKVADSGQPSVLEPDEFSVPTVDDMFFNIMSVQAGGKVRSLCWARPAGKHKNLHFMVATTNNLVEMYDITKSHRAAGEVVEPVCHRSLVVDLPGHRTDVRTLALSSDDRMLASASLGQLKIWNLKTRSCLRTLDCGQAFCSSFLPGDRMVLLGTKSGHLELYDISTGTLVEKLAAHESQTVWSMAVHPDGKSVVTGGADKWVRFWRFDVVDEEIPGTKRTTKRLKLTKTRKLKLADEVLSVCFSSDQRLLAVATLDSTVQIFYVDSLKLFLPLYGHKLPVLNISISSDSRLIATCSADKNVRIWGLDFGDCHKAFFAHQDTVLAVDFIPHPVESDEKHIVFSISKDGTLKSWDVDKFEQIQKLDGHHAEVWAMAVGHTGEVVVTASHDKSIRIWEIGDDQVFLQEEREMEEERMHDMAFVQGLDRDSRNEDEQRRDEVAVASKQTIATRTHGENVLDALELGMADLQAMRDFHDGKTGKPQRDPIFLALGNISAEQYVLDTLRKVPTSALQDALLVIPFSSLPTLFTFLTMFLQNRMLPELSWRVAYFMLQTHMRQIVASTQLRPQLEQVLRAYTAWQAEQKKMMGFNLAGLEMLCREARDKENMKGRYLMEADEEIDDEKSKRKRAFAHVA
ncbi:WD40 repeat-like protein [Piedraia hortae CBS 480.64]|uniref:WD40 repeat-like protein n=1 Tax=Piedraia hortae CBS 480.64 TaxID=1314780 RepID=A0A6A7BUA4_9PEZI|nr:WD40 repeat-like protein [Piedraia hortae CBS 480.64]